MRMFVCGWLAAFLAAPLWGAEDCQAPPREKWAEVCETVRIRVPVTEYIEEPCEVKVTRMCPVEKQVETRVGKWIYEECEVKTTRKVVECESYTVNETRYEIRPEIRVRRAPRIVCEEVEKTVVDKVCEEVYDPATCSTRKVWTDVRRTVAVPVERRVMIEEEYTVDVKCPVQYPVVKTRKVVREVPETRMLRTPKYVYETAIKTVKVMEPKVETVTVLRKRAVKTYKTIEKQVVKRVKVPAEPEC
jgi:hypothetical protein